MDGVGTLDAMPPVGIFHEVELFVERDQFVQQSLRALEVDVVIARAVDDRAACP